MNWPDIWDYSRQKKQFPYGTTTAYELGAKFLDGYCDVVEDWGCGTAWARQFYHISRYIGIDGAVSRWNDIVTDLHCYTSKVDGIFMRSVLEHNNDWPLILTNALNSFTKRMVIILFTDLSEENDRVVQSHGNIPDINLSKEKFYAMINPYLIEELTIKSDTLYGQEHIFYLSKENK